MTAVWAKRESGWQRLGTRSYPDEDALHSLVEEAPHTLPLSGSPTPVVLGREVRLGSGRLDLFAVEPDGRPVIIEIKLARNSEARRAVVSQVLAYAAALHDLDVRGLESILQSHLGGRTIAAAVAEDAQLPEFDEDAFLEALAEHLRDGAFRLVIVLDDVPDELLQIARYLEHVTTDRILIDLVVVSSFEVGGVQLMVPQRVDPVRSEAFQRAESSSRDGRRTAQSPTRSVDGASPFLDEARKVLPGQTAIIEELARWCARLAAEPDVHLLTYFGKQWTVLLPRLRSQNDVSLVSFYLNAKGITGQAFNTVFERAAPEYLPKLEAVCGRPIGKGTSTGEMTSEILTVIREAYDAALDQSRTN